MKINEPDFLFWLALCPILFAFIPVAIDDKYPRLAKALFKFYFAFAAVPIIYIGYLIVKL
jgi:hypothetical protein